ncbi:hypothetical protein V9T40_006178 [Parthenolecanium corni]|uniref:Uncharacterized protein n=1 Tax=Parthenolecanium corni TaxID=536013 RepID=A0AAN9TWB2_9HEMI
MYDTSQKTNILRTPDLCRKTPPGPLRKTVRTTKTIANILKSKAAAKAKKIKRNDSDRSPKRNIFEDVAVANTSAKRVSPKASKPFSNHSSPATTAVFQVPENKKLTPTRVPKETIDSETDFWNLRDHPSWNILFSLVKSDEYSPAYSDSSSSGMSADEQQKIFKKYKKYKKRKRHYQHLLLGKPSKKSKHSRSSSERHADSPDSKEPT